jgi:hypothetical protein
MTLLKKVGKRQVKELCDDLFAHARPVCLTNYVPYQEEDTDEMEIAVKETSTPSLPFPVSIPYGIPAVPLGESAGEWGFALVLINTTSAVYVRVTRIPTRFCYEATLVDIKGAPVYADPEPGWAETIGSLDEHGRTDGTGALGRDMRIESGPTGYYTVMIAATIPDVLQAWGILLLTSNRLLFRQSEPQEANGTYGAWANELILRAYVFVDWLGSASLSKLSRLSGSGFGCWTKLPAYQKAVREPVLRKLVARIDGVAPEDTPAEIEELLADLRIVKGPDIQVLDDGPHGYEETIQKWRAILEQTCANRHRALNFGVTKGRRALRL